MSDSVFPALQLDPKVFASEMRIAAAIKWYELGRVSQGEGAEVANLSRAGFIAALSAAKVSPFEISDVAQMEHREDIYLSTLRVYLEALGGSLEVVARFLRLSEFTMCPKNFRSSIIWQTVSLTDKNEAEII